MNVNEIAQYIQGRYKTYTYYKTLLPDMTKETFNDNLNDLFDDISQDAKYQHDLLRQSYSKPLIQMFNDLSRYSQSVLELFSLYKTLREF